MSGRDEPRCPVVAIVGAGLAGTLTAVALLQRPAGGVRIVLVDRSGDFGPGVAYSTSRDEHLLNQPAERMSAFAHAPEHFRRWAGARDPGAFLPRRLYGEYLRAVLDEAAHGRPVERIAGEAVALRPGGDGVTLRLADGRTVACDRVVLATGPLPPRRPALLPLDPRVAADPWAPGALDPLPSGATAVLVGTGLTAVDAALSLCATGRVVAVSRGGRLPFAHLPGLRAPAPTPAPPATGLDLAELEHLVRAHAARMRGAGYDWRDVIDGLRPVVSDLWRALPLDERRRFLRTHARAWERRRHRMAPAVAARVRELRASGRLVLRAGGITSARATATGIEVVLGDDDETVNAARVIVCTGPADDVTRAREPLLRALLAGGLAAPDALGLGLRTTSTGAVVDRQRRPSRLLYALGALRRGEQWESTAAAEIRTQAVAIAGELATQPRETLAGHIV